MKEGFLFCVCQGTCPSFAKENAYEITNMVRKTHNVEFAAIHPQLCADDGDRFLRNLLKNTNIDKCQYVMEENIELLKALADDTRFKIVEYLLEGEKCVCEIFPHVKRTQSTVSIHLGNLENGGVLESRREGKKIFYKIKDKRVCDVFKAIGNKKDKILKKSCCYK